MDKVEKKTESYQDTHEWRKRCREIAATKCTDNIYELIRVRIVRVMREHENAEWAAEELGVSESTVRRYMRFVPFEHLMRDPSLENCFDWRSMTNRKWVKLLRKHPDMIRHLKKNHTLGGWEVLDILLDRPELASHFDLSEWNRLGLEFYWSHLLVRHPEFAEQCDLSVVTARAAADLLMRHPQFFDRIRIDTLWPYHWTEIIQCQPQIEKKMEAKPHSEWPFNYWVHALQFHPELEPEFHGWDKIECSDAEDFKRRQPGMYLRHLFNDPKWVDHSDEPKTIQSNHQMNSEEQNSKRNNTDSLDQLHEQAHILEALHLVISDRKIVEAIRMHCDEKATKDDITHALFQAAFGVKDLVDRFNLDKAQAEYVLNLSWNELHNLLSEDLEGQYNDLMSRIAGLEGKESVLVSAENK